MTVSDRGLFGSYLLNRHAIDYADLHYQWREEQRHYACARDGLRTFTHAEYVVHTGVRVRCGGNDLIFDDADPDTARLREWLAEGVQPTPIGHS